MNTKSKGKIELTKENLQKLYVEQGLTIRECANAFGMQTHGGISWRLKKFGIKARPSKFQEGNRKPGDRKPEQHGNWQGGKQVVFCTQCGSKIKRFPSLIHEMNFCSQYCYGQWRAHNFIGKLNPNYGNDKMIGDGNSNWKGGISFEPYPCTWSFKLREKIRNRDGRKCQVCGKLEDCVRHDVHHIDYNKDNVNPENLITLCKKCHIKTNYNREQWQEFFLTKYQVPMTGTDQ